MLTEEETREIEREIRHYDEKRGGCIEALKIVQRRRGWISDEALEDVADFLEMSPDELDSVATFYSLIFRRRAGRHVILICDSAVCWTMGYESLAAHLTARLGIGLGETTFDNRFTLLPAACLGACDHAPALMIDGDLHKDMSVEKLDAILERYG